jgi:hypothetical protein
LSPVELDGLIFSDLFAALSVSVENAVLYDADFGLDTLATSTGTVLATASSDTSDVLASFAQALNAIATIRYNTADVVAVTHPSVILHQTSHVDTTGRPIYLGDHSFNPAGIPGPVSSLGQTVAPAVTIQGVPVYSDANITISSGTAPIYFIKLDDSFVNEFGPVSLASPHTAALQIAWLLRTHSILGGCDASVSGGACEGHRVHHCHNRIRRELKGLAAARREAPVLALAGCFSRRQLGEPVRVFSASIGPFAPSRLTTPKSDDTRTE